MKKEIYYSSVAEFLQKDFNGLMEDWKVIQL